MRIGLATVLAAIGILASVSLSTANAAVPEYLSFQGFLTDVDGNPVDGPRSVKFTLYAAEVGGQSLWTQTVQADIQNGLLAVLLGGPNSDLAAVFLGEDPIWLGVKIGNDTEMSPRQPIGAVPWAMRASTADNVPTNSQIKDLVAQVGYLKTEVDPSVNALGKAQISCAEGQIAKFDGESWTCAPDLDTLAGLACIERETPVLGPDGWECGPATALPAFGGGLELTPDGELSLDQNCADKELMKFNLASGQWKCSPDQGVVTEVDPSVNALGRASLACATNEIAKMQADGKWHCSPDADSIYNGGTGVILEGASFSLDMNFTDLVYVNEGQAGAITSHMISDHAVGPQDLAETYSLSTHNHDGVYSVTTHNHDATYATKSHNHDAAYSALNHNHDTAYSALNHNHDTSYSALGHNHDSRYYTRTETDSDFARISHTHTTTDLPSSVMYTNNDQTVIGSNIFSGTNTFQGNTSFSGTTVDFKTAPKFSNASAAFTVASSTKVDKLNADLLDGSHSTDFALSAHEHDARYVNEDQAASVSSTMLKTMTYKYSIPAATMAYYDDTGSCNTIRGVGAGTNSQGATIYMTRDTAGACSFYFPVIMPIMSNGRANTIKTLDICYHTSAAATYITGTYLYSEDSDGMTVLASDTTNRTSTSATCYTLTVDKTIASTKTLSFKLTTTHALTTDRIWVSHIVLGLEN